jgi:hypothetical protein
MTQLSINNYSYFFTFIKIFDLISIHKIINDKALYVFLCGDLIKVAACSF